MITGKKKYCFLFFLYIIFSIIIGLFGNTFAFNVDNFFVPLYEANLRNIYNNFFYYDDYTGYNFPKIFQTIPIILNFFVINIDFMINQKQTSSIFLSFYFINYLCFYVYLKKKFTDQKKIIINSIFLSTSTVLTCSISLGFSNVTYILVFFPFLMGWCENKLESRYAFFYFLLTMGNIGMLFFSIIFVILFCENFKKRYFDFIKIIFIPVLIFLTFYLLVEQNILQYAISKNQASIFMGNSPLYTFFNVGFLDRSNQIILFNNFFFFVCFFYLSFYLYLIFQIKKNFVSFKTKLSFILFLLVIFYMFMGNLFPEFYNLLYKKIPFLIALRGQYIFNIFSLIFFIYFFLNSEDNFIKNGLIYVTIFFQIMNISLLFFSKNHLEYNNKNFHYTNYNYYKNLDKYLNLENNNVFFPLDSVNTIKEQNGNLRNGSGYNYHFGKYNPIIIQLFLEENGFQKTLEKFNFEKIIVVKNDLFLKINEIDLKYLDKISEDEQFIIYKNTLYKKNYKCLINLNYYNCIDNKIKDLNISNIKKNHESINFREIKKFEIILFHSFQILLTIIFFFSFIKILILK